METTSVQKRHEYLDLCIPDPNHLLEKNCAVNDSKDTPQLEATSTMQCRRSNDRRCIGRKVGKETPKETYDGGSVLSKDRNSTNIEDATCLRARNKYAGGITGKPSRRYAQDIIQSPYQQSAGQIASMNDELSLVLSTSGKRISGAKLFWHAKEIWDPFQCLKVKNQRVVPQAPVVVVECGSFLGAPNQYKALMCMVQITFVWRLCCVHKITFQQVVVSTFLPGNLMSVSVTLESQVIQSLIFVNVFSTTCSQFINPAVINTIDNALDSQPIPSGFGGVYLPTMKDTSKNQLDQFLFKKKQKKERQRFKRLFVVKVPQKIELGWKRTKNRNRGRGGKGYKKIKNLPYEYITIFYPRDVSLPYDSVKKQKRNTLVIPELERLFLKKVKNVNFYKRIYHIIPTSSLPKIHGIPVNEMSNCIKQLAQSSFSIIDIDSDNPVRLFFTETSDIEKLLKSDIGEAVVEIHDILKAPIYMVKTGVANCLLPGVCVSMWDQSLRLPEFSLAECQNLQKCFGEGFGSRRCSWSCGMNLYLGARQNRLANDAPNLRGEVVSEVEYCKEFFNNWALQAPLRKKVCASVKIDIDVVRRLNPNFFCFIGYGACSRFMWTQGTLVSTSKSQSNLSSVKTIGFANGIHFDKGDKIDKTTAENWLLEIPNNKYKKWLGKIGNSVGYGLPTSCGYNHVGNRMGRSVVAKFIIGPFSFDLKHQTFHHFLGYAVPHCTVVPFLYDDKLHVSNSGGPNQFLVAAWGGAGSKKNASNHRKKVGGFTGI